MLDRQADAAKTFIGEYLQTLVGFHFTFNPRYAIAVENLDKDVKTFEGQAARPWAEIKANLGFVSQAQPFLQTLFPGFGGMVGGIAVRANTL